MRLDIGCELLFQAAAPTPVLLMLRPRNGASQWIIQEECLFYPYITGVEYRDSYGNLCQKLMIPMGEFHLRVSARVDVAERLAVNPEAAFVPIQELPDEVLRFLLPSRYCQSDLEAIALVAQSIVAPHPVGYVQVEAIRQWIYDHLSYCYGTSTPNTCALETLEQRQGVCRDFAHLGIALCRSVNIPARMVVGYLYELKPMDLHAWFEAFVGDRWYTFDATQSHPKGNRVAIAFGRDATDVAMVTQFGPLVLEQMHVWVRPADLVASVPSFLPGSPQLPQNDAERQ